MMRRAGLVLVVLLLVGGAGGWLFYQRFNQPYQGYDAGEQFVELNPGDGTPIISRKLVEAGVVRDRRTFRLALWLTGAARKLKAGEYRFDRPMTPTDVVQQACARRGVPAADDVSRRPDHPRDGGASSSRTGFGPAPTSSRPQGTCPRCAISTRQRATWRVTLSRDLQRCSRHAGATELVRMMVGAFPPGVFRGVARRGRPARACRCARR